MTGIPDGFAEHDETGTRRFLDCFASALGIGDEAAAHVQLTGIGSLRSAFAVSDFATASVAAAAASLAGLLRTQFSIAPRVSVNRRLSSLWFGLSIRPQGWTLPSLWDSIAGDYAAQDGWIRLHTNASHHRAAALAVLGVAADRTAVARAAGTWNANALEEAIVQNKGCAAVMRTREAWRVHPQGSAVAAEPLLTTRATGDATSRSRAATPARPLEGVRVLDLTRVLAGPVATRFLAGFGAEVLRIDPPGWDEPGVIPEVALGKRCARLDLRDPAQHAVFVELLRQADVLVHGYRADALGRLGLDAESRRRIRPDLIDVSLDAYGWNGPWRNRRGFDSLVQMSAGIAEAGMRAFHKDRPTPLPVQALDHATGYLMAAAVLRGLERRIATGGGFEARASLARTAHALMSGPEGKATADFAAASQSDYCAAIENTDFGPALRLAPPVAIDGTAMRWDLPAARLGSSPPAWR
jgi:hypothetical protein